MTAIDRKTRAGRERSEIAHQVQHRADDLGRLARAAERQDTGRLLREGIGARPVSVRPSMIR